MLVSMKEMLHHADKNNYAIMAINCCNMECAKAIIGAAETECSPVIINISPRQWKSHASLDATVPMIQSMAQKTYVPIALNLDHGQEYNDVVDAIQHGFTNIMFDGSALPYQENLERTALISDLAHASGCSIEAELGHVGQASAGDGASDDFYTHVDQAVEFVKQTHVDALAVAIGTAHGQYPQGYVPHLDFQRLKELKAALQMPLVLHGGSGAGQKNIQKAVALGINKINVCTDVFAVGRDRMKTSLEENPHIDLLDLCHGAEMAMKEYICSYMQMIGSSQRYCYCMSVKKEFD